MVQDIFDKLILAIKFVVHGNPMNYNSLIFFCFLLFFLGIYFLLKKQRVKMLWILAADLLFYAWSGCAALVIVLATALIVYLASRRMERVYDQYETEKEGLTPKEQTRLFSCYQKRTKKFLVLAMFCILAVWIYVKAGKLLEFETVTTFYKWIPGKSIIVPLGISYYTLSSIGYLLDVFWRKVKPEHDFLCLFTVMIYFPHIVQGPISRYEKMVEQIKHLPAFDYNRVCFGLQLMLWGYIKKLVIADHLVRYTSTIFAEPYDFAGIEIFLAVVFCAVELYADFSGCMDIVGGISQTIGIELEVNFRQPFFSRSAAEFWRRWHITLGTWTKDYIYLPIAMNPKFMKWTRKKKKEGKEKLSSFVKAFCPLIAVWLFTGLWHGTGVDYIVWGLYWCLLMTASKEAETLLGRISSFLKIDKDRRYYGLWEMVRTYFIFAIGRTFTLTDSLGQTVVLWKQLFSQLRLWTLFDGSLYSHGLERKDFYVVLAGLFFMLGVDLFHERGMKIRAMIAAQPLVLRWVIYLGAMFAIVIFGRYGSGFNSSGFAYGAF